MSTTIQPSKKVCVTGGAGFIGSHLVRALLQGGIAVTVLDNLSVGKAENVPPGARLIVGDVLDSGSSAEAVAECDVVFHLAARVAIRASFEFVKEDTETNVAGTASVLRAAHRAGSVRKVVTASSMAVYADSTERRPIGENFPTEPISPYGISKLAAERLTHCVCAQAGIQSMVLRLFNTYGPGQTLSPYVGVVTIFVNRLFAGKQPTIFGDGQQCRDFVHVEDVVSAFLKTLDANVSGQTMNVGTGIPVTVNEVFQHLQRVMKISSRALHVEAVPGELRYSVADISKARRLLGYQPVHRFDRSVEEVVAEILGTAAARPN
jgi:UDP-glucose 4-epimerase